MLDLKFVRENPDIVKQNIKNKFQDRKLPLVDEVIELDAKARAVKTEADELRANRNKLSKQIGALMGQGKKEEAEELKKKVQENAERVEALSKEEKDNFLLAQESWDKYVSMDMQFDDICKTLHNYNGSMQTYQTLIEKARLYRERTIKVKYMHYLIELDLGKISFDSLTFANQN